MFAPTYKYIRSYAGETTKSKSKRRTWHGAIESYGAATESINCPTYAVNRDSPIIGRFALSSRWKWRLVVGNLPDTERASPAPALTWCSTIFFWSRGLGIADLCGIGGSEFWVKV